MRSLEDFHLAGRSLRMILLTGTFCATIVGASSTIGMAGLGFSKGLPGAWWMLSGTIGMLVLTFFAGKIRSTGCYTLPQLVGSFYGERTRIAASVLIAVSWVGVIAVQIIASGNVLSAVFGGNRTLFMVSLHRGIRALHSARRAKLGRKNRSGAVPDNNSGNDSSIPGGSKCIRAGPSLKPEFSHI